MVHILRGLRYLLRHKRLWRFMAKPLLSAVALTLALIVVWVVLAGTLLSQFVASTFGVVGAVGSFGGTLLAVGVSILVFNPLFFMVAVLATSQKWEQLSLEIEETAMGHSNVPTSKLGFRRTLKDMSFRVPVGLFVGLVATVLSLFGLFWLGAVLIGTMLSFDVTAPAFARRQLIFPTQARSALACRGYFSFWVVCWLASIIPIVNLLCLPALVAGGTLLVAEQDKRNRTLPA